MGLTLSSAGIYWEENQAEHAVQHVQRILRKELALLSACQDVDLVSRGFALTKDPVFSARFAKAQRALQSLNEELKGLISDHQIESVDVGSTIDAAIFGLVKSSEKLKNTGRDTDALAQKLAMDQLRSIIARLMDDEARLLEQRKAASAVQEKYLWSAIGVQLFAGLGLVYAMRTALIRYDRETEEKIKILEDASKLAQRGKELAEEALQTKSRFLATVSHEVRTPMVGVIGLAELLSFEDLGSEANSSVHLILESSKRLLQILNNVLDAAKLHAGAYRLEYREFPVRTLIGDVTQLITPEALKKGIHITAQCDNEIPELVCGDELRVRQVLLNLGFNAVKFTEKGDVRVQARLKERISDNIVVSFSVTDTGSGISPEQQAGLFEPFVQLQDSTARVSGGSGLGLNISKNLVDLMGGEIGLTSELGKGSTFWFDIPFLERNCKI